MNVTYLVNLAPDSQSMFRRHISCRFFAPELPEAWGFGAIVRPRESSSILNRTSDVVFARDIEDSGMTLVIPPILDSIFVAWFNGSVGGVTQPCSRSLVLSTLIIGRLKVSTQTDVEICSLNS